MFKEQSLQLIRQVLYLWINISVFLVDKLSHTNYSSSHLYFDINFVILCANMLNFVDNQIRVMYITSYNVTELRKWGCITVSCRIINIRWKKWESKERKRPIKRERDRWELVNLMYVCGKVEQISVNKIIWLVVWNNFCIHENLSCSKKEKREMSKEFLKEKFCYGLKKYVLQ